MPHFTLTEYFGWSELYFLYEVAGVSCVLSLCGWLSYWYIYLYSIFFSDYVQNRTQNNFNVGLGVWCRRL